VGRELVQTLENEARENGLYTLFAFTYVPGFFGKLGFEEVDRAELPLKAWKDCMRCPKFHACDEIAMLKKLRPDPAPPLRPEALLSIGEIPILPILRS
jgi:amino-acid N-acetyltransferase